MSRRSPMVVALLVALAVLSHGGLLLYALPAILLVAVFKLGLFPGERAIVARRAARPAGRVRVPRALGSAGRQPHASSPTGTALLAFNRAVRPPPASLLGF